MFKLFDKIYRAHKKKLKNLNTENKKILICFAAVPGSGKSTIADILEKKYKAVCIRTDDITKIITKLGNFKNNFIDDGERKLILKTYLFWFLENYNFKNQFIILDASIDRTYLRINILAKQLDYELFVIDIETNNQTLISRYWKRNKNAFLSFIRKLKSWKYDHKNFLKYHRHEIIIRNEGKLDLTKLYEKLDKKLNSR